MFPISSPTHQNAFVREGRSLLLLQLPSFGVRAFVCFVWPYGYRRGLIIVAILCSPMQCCSRACFSNMKIFDVISF
jgi:hypothetical protein